MTTVVKVGDPIIARIVEFIGDRRDVTRRDLAVALSASYTRVKVAMTLANELGLLRPYRIGRVGYWASPAVAEQIKAEYAALRRERDMSIRRRHRKAADQDDDETPDWEIQRSFVRACDMPPPSTNAVNSVFALGNMA